MSLPYFNAFQVQCSRPVLAESDGCMRWHKNGAVPQWLFACLKAQTASQAHTHHPVKRQRSQATGTVSGTASSSVKLPSSPDPSLTEAQLKKEHIRQVSYVCHMQWTRTVLKHRLNMPLPSRSSQLAQGLATRLQYAAFKVERGWTKHSLPEVENLYWRASKGSHASAPTSTASTTLRPTHTSSSSSSRLHPTTGATSSASAASLPAHQDDHEEEDVFGSVSTNNQLPSQRQRISPPPSTSTSTSTSRHILINSHGLPTPPPSEGTDLSTLSSTRLGKLVSRRISPTRQVRAAIFRQAGGASNDTTSTTTVTGAGPASAAPTVGSGYADFWSKLGSTPNAEAAASGARKRPRESDAAL